MGECICFLITLSNMDVLLRCALKIKRDLINENTIEHYLETEAREELKSLLPGHVQSFGDIVEVQKIFEICEHV